MKRRVVVKWTTALLIVFIAMGVAPSHPSGPCGRRYVRFHLRRCTKAAVETVRLLRRLQTSKIEW